MGERVFAESGSYLQQQFVSFGRGEVLDPREVSILVGEGAVDMRLSSTSGFVLDHCESMANSVPYGEVDSMVYMVQPGLFQ